MSKEYILHKDQVYDIAKDAVYDNVEEDLEGTITILKTFINENGEMVVTYEEDTEDNNEEEE